MDDLPHKANIIASLILQRPMCIRCIATKASTSETVVEASIDGMATVMRLRREFSGRCLACGCIDTVVSFARADLT